MRRRRQQRWVKGKRVRVRVEGWNWVDLILVAISLLPQAAAAAVAAGGEAGPSSVVITEEPSAPPPPPPPKAVEKAKPSEDEAAVPPPPPATATATGGAGLQDAKHTVAGFNAEETPLSTFMLDGIDYKKMRELQMKGIRDIARDWAGVKRERKSRTTDMLVEGVGRVQVLKENDYTMQEVRGQRTVLPFWIDRLDSIPALS